MLLAAKRAVVTGASSGIGRAIAEAFLREGAAVVAAYGRNHAAAEALLGAGRAAGADVSTISVDLADEHAPAALAQEAARRLGGIDVWANIAGADILTGAAAAAADTVKLQRLLDVDLRGTMLCCWAAAEHMRAGGGAILNMSWDLALVGMGERNPEMFAAAKAGVSGFTRSFALSEAPRIRVNEVAPGWIETAFAADDMAPDYRARVIADTPLGRFGAPADVAEAAVFLCCDRAAFITGQTLKVNGGLSS